MGVVLQIEPAADASGCADRDQCRSRAGLAGAAWKDFNQQGL